MHPHIKANLAATSGIHTAEDVVKMLIVGASITMVASVLLKEGISYLSTLEKGLREWMSQNDYNAIAELHGILHQFSKKDASEIERAQYLETLTSFKPFA